MRGKRRVASWGLALGTLLSAGPASAQSGGQAQPRSFLPNAILGRALRRPTRITPTPAAKKARPKVEPCAGLAPRAGALPFSPGEELSYDITIAGLYVGRLETKVGRPRSVSGKPALTLFGRAFSNSVVSGIQKFQGRYMALSDPTTLRPYGVRVDGSYGDDLRTEETRFSSDQKNVESDFLHRGVTGHRSYTRQAPIFDGLSLLFHARTMSLAAGQSYCQEIFSARRLWRMEAKVLGASSVSTPVGDKPVDKVELSFTRMPHQDFPRNLPPPRMTMIVYLSQDGTRTPMAFDITSKQGSAHAELKRWIVNGDQRDADWVF